MYPPLTSSPFPGFLTRAAALLGLGVVDLGYAANPIISTFTPDNGRPGTVVTINGSAFTDAVKVEFGDSKEAAFVRVSANQLVAVVPEDGLTGSIRVTPASGTTGISASTFWVAPRIADFTPGRGSTTTTITVNGANFIPGSFQGNPYTVVFFGTNVSPQVSVTAPSQLQARVPTGISNAVLTVATFAGAATSVVEFVTTTLPVIEDFSPENGLPGQSVPVVIFGANLLSASSVKFNGLASGFTATADNVINTTIPAGATSGPITVTSAAGTGTSLVNFVVGPTIDNNPPLAPPFNPMAGTPGEFIYIYGNDFTGVTNVSFNGVLAGSANVHLPANNQVRVRIPTGASTGKVKVLTGSNGEAVSPVDFTIGPLIESLSTTYGPVGSDVTVYGGGFTAGATQVKFGTIPSTPTSYPANNQFIVKVPTGATNAPITVSTSFGTNLTPYKFLVTTSIPVVEDFEPKQGPQGTSIQIRGAKFTGATQVTIGGVPVANPQVTADSLILATVPAGVITGPVRVINASGTGVSLQSFNAPPWITSFTPASGQAGAIISVRGTNFAGTTDLYLGSGRGTILEVTPGEVIAQVTTNARTGALTLLAPGGSFVTTNAFTVLPRILDFQPRLGPVGTLVTITGTSFFNVTNVTFANNVNATYPVISPQEIRATVPVAAITGLIRVSTVDGNADTPQAFTVTQPGDLRLAEALSTNVALPLQLVTYTTSITNFGPSIQSGVRLTNSFAAGLSVQSAVASQGGCVIAGSVVTCNLGTLSNNFSATVTITARGAQSGVYTNFVAARSIEGDSQPANNTAQNTLVVATEAERTLGIELLSAPERVVVKWPFSAVPFKLQHNSVLGDTNVPWTTITPLPPPVNGTNRFTNTAPDASAAEYFRLRYP